MCCIGTVRDVSAQRRATLLAELLAAKPGKDAARKGATELPPPAAAAAFPRCADVAAIRAARREAHLDPTEKRISAILLGRVEWELPPFPVANGPLFAVSRTLASMVVADLALGDIDNPAPRADGAYAGPNGWVAQLEATELGRRWNASLQPGGPKKPKETDRRSCWPNSDAALGLFVVKAALSRRRPITLVNTPIGVQHFPWPVYSEEHGFSNRSIVFHGAKRSASRAWRLAPRSQLVLKCGQLASCDAGFHHWPPRHFSPQVQDEMERETGGLRPALNRSEVLSHKYVALVEGVCGTSASRSVAEFGAGSATFWLESPVPQ